MIDLYFYDTPNGYKITIFLEEAGLPYRIIALDLTRGEHLTPEYTKINPNNQMPAIIDRNGPGGKPYKVFESGAILLYLAEKAGQLMPTETGPRYEVIQWLMLQMGRIGPFFGQAVAFRRMEEQIPFAVDKFTKEARRLFGVLDRRLGEVPYLGGSVVTSGQERLVVRRERTGPKAGAAVGNIDTSEILPGLRVPNPH